MTGTQGKEERPLTDDEREIATLRLELRNMSENCRIATREAVKYATKHGEERARAEQAEADYAAVFEELCGHVLGTSYMDDEAELPNKRHCMLCRAESQFPSELVHKPDCIMGKDHPGTALLAKLRALEAFIRKLTKQQLPSEVIDDEQDNADFEGAYIAIVTEARALEAKP